MQRQTAPDDLWKTKYFQASVKHSLLHNYPGDNGEMLTHPLHTHVHTCPHAHRVREERNPLYPSWLDVPATHPQCSLLFHN